MIKNIFCSYLALRVKNKERHHLQGCYVMWLLEEPIEAHLLWLLVTVNIPSSPILVTLMMEAIRSLQNVSSYKSHMA
jgi:hypothetical protein